MNTWFDRRALIFYAFAVVCFVLIPFAPTQYSYVGRVLGIAYVVLGSLSWRDRLAHWRSHPSHRTEK